MATNSSIESQPENIDKYPYLGIFDGHSSGDMYKGTFIVWFLSKGKGVVVWVNDKSPWKIGAGGAKESWIEDSFTPTNHKVTLQNRM